MERSGGKREARDRIPVEREVIEKEKEREREFPLFIYIYIYIYF